MTSLLSHFLEIIFYITLRKISTGDQLEVRLASAYFALLWLFLEGFFFKKKNRPYVYKESQTASLFNFIMDHITFTNDNSLFPFFLEKKKKRVLKIFRGREMAGWLADRNFSVHTVQTELHGHFIYSF